MKKFEAATGVDENGQPIVPKVRKYTKSGALRKPYQSRKSTAKLAASGDKSALDSTSRQQTGDGDATMGENASLNSSLNTSTQPAAPGGPSQAPVVTKRKYQKRKKPGGETGSGAPGGPVVASASNEDSTPLDPSVASTPAGSTGLAKVEGTKLIIQKKAIKLALNSANSSGKLSKYLFSVSERNRNFRKDLKWSNLQVFKAFIFLLFNHLNLFKDEK